MKRLLLIDTATEPATVALVTSRKILAETTVANRRELSERLLAEIDALTESARLPLGTISAIGVVTGPGSFTALRIGVAVANALAYAHDVPVVGVTVDEAPSVTTFTEVVAERLAAGQTAEAVLPEYGREPSITPPQAA